MKPPMIAGIALLALGIFVLIAAPTWGTRHSMMRVGDMEISAEGSRSIPPWVGWVGIVSGVVLLGTGAAKRRAA